MSVRLAPTRNGTGVLALAAVDPGGEVLELTGPLCVGPVPPEWGDHVVEVGRHCGQRVFMGRSGGADDYVNHSCEPNAMVSVTPSRVSLLAMRRIMPGEEVTFDYSTSSTESYEEWSMDCRCGTPSCRARISGFHTVPEARRAELVAAGAVPAYVLDAIRQGLVTGAAKL